MTTKLLKGSLEVMMMMTITTTMMTMTMSTIWTMTSMTLKDSLMMVMKENKTMREYWTKSMKMKRIYTIRANFEFPIPHNFSMTYLQCSNAKLCCKVPKPLYPLSNQFMSFLTQFVHQFEIENKLLFYLKSLLQIQ